MTTKRMMDKEGIEYSEVDLREVPEKLEEFREQGFTAAPIVTTDIKVWSGFRYEKISSLAQYLHTEKVVEGRQSAA
jgi:glutaredoxin-like protein NrdH